MHLVIFPLILYLIATGPILLLWPQRGLCAKNYWLAILSAMLGLIAGFIFLISLKDYIDPAVSMYFMFFLLPLAVAASAVWKLGSKGRSLSNGNSIMLLNPALAIKSFLVATATASVSAVAIALIIGIEKTSIAIVGALVLPLSMGGFLARSNYIVKSNVRISVTSSLLVGCILFLLSFLMGPYFLAGLPLVLFAVVSSFIFHYLIYVKQKPDNSNHQRPAAGTR